MEDTGVDRAIERLCLRDVLIGLHRYLFLLLLFPFFCAFLGVVAVHSIVPVSYRAEVQLLVTPAAASDTTVTYDRLMAAAQLSATDAAVLKSNRILDKVKANLRLSVSDTELASHISVKCIQQTGVLLISADADTPEMAMRVVREIARVGPKAISDMAYLGSIQPVADPTADETPVAPDLWAVGGVCYAIGWGIAIFLALFLEYWHKGYHTAREVAKHTDLPVLGVLPLAVVKDS
ncbi:MAG: Wzz/FepE/Etk N-terminal domain-containing protein [Ethanoligenens sp.]